MIRGRSRGVVILFCGTLACGILELAIYPQTSMAANPVKADGDLVDADGSSDFLSNVRQITFGGRRAGEGYFSTDGSKMIFQSERDPKNPFYQIFVLDLRTGDTQLVSTGTGKTTCPWFHPDAQHALFASTHEDPNSLALQKAGLDQRASGKTKRYEWDYDEHYEIYSTKIASGKFLNLTNTIGYDAEGSYSPDGKWIAFCSNRHAYQGDLSDEDRRLLEIDAKYFLDIYLMRADGSDVKRLTDVVGYDGGPFFSPDGKRICWRRFTPDGNVAEIWTMNTDGSDQRQITNLGQMSWAPFYHPSGEYLIFTSDINGRSNFELYIVDVDGKKNPIRVSNLPAFDGLPVFFPDGKRLAWTANRTPNKKGQVFFADFDDAKARRLLSLAKRRQATVTDSPSKPRKSVETSPAITLDDTVRYHERILELVKKNESGPAAVGYLIETLESFGFADPELAENGKGDTILALTLRPAERAGDGLVYACLSLDKPSSEVERNEFASQLAGLIEIAEYISFEARHEAGDIARTVLLHIVFEANQSKQESWFAQASETFGKGYAAAVEINGLTGRNGTYVIDGVGTSPRWSRLIEKLNIPVGLPLKIRTAPQLDSLAYLLYERKVPAISISPIPTKGDPVDAKSNLKKPDLRATKLAARILTQLAKEPKAPQFTPITERQGAAKGLPYLGTKPDYRGGIEGVKLKGVVEDGPAHKGGLRAGDIIVQIGETPIPDIHAYAAAMDDLTVGANILITVVRDGERLPVRVTVGERKP